VKGRSVGNGAPGIGLDLEEPEGAVLAGDDEGGLAAGEANEVETVGAGWTA